VPANFEGNLFALFSHFLAKKTQCQRWTAVQLELELSGQDQEANATAKRKTRPAQSFYHAKNHMKFDRKLHDLMPPTWLEEKRGKPTEGKAT